MPNDVLSRRPAVGGSPTLLAAQLITEIHELLRDHHAALEGHRLVYRLNERGEPVISLVLPARSAD